MILYFFYKNMLFSLPQFFFGFANLMSGSSIFDALYITMYNMIFTAWPLMIYATFDWDINYKKLKVKGSTVVLQVHEPLRAIMPRFYHTGQKNKVFNNTSFFYSIFMGGIHALILYLINLYCLNENFMIDGDGYIVDHWMYSLHIFSSIMIVMLF